MSISLAAIKSAYEDLGLLVATTLSHKSDIPDLGPIPEFPVDVVSDSDYNDVLTARVSWTTSFKSINNAINTAVAAQLAQEKVVRDLMAPNQWFALARLENWSATTSQWIGIKDNRASNADLNNGYTIGVGSVFTIIMSSVEPSFQFPSV